MPGRMAGAPIVGVRRWMNHYLSPLLAPQSVALVGASDRVGSLGRTVFEDLLSGQFKGDIYAVNPHRFSLEDILVQVLAGQTAVPAAAPVARPAKR